MWSGLSRGGPQLSRKTLVDKISMSNTQDIFGPIDAGDIDGVRQLLDADAGLVHVRVQELTP